MTRSKAEQRAVSRVPATCWCAFHLYIWRVRVRFGSVHNRAVHALSRAIEGSAIVSPCLIDGAAARRLHTDPAAAPDSLPLRRYVPSAPRCIVRFMHHGWAARHLSRNAAAPIGSDRRRPMRPGETMGERRPDIDTMCTRFTDRHRTHLRCPTHRRGGTAQSTGRNNTALNA